MSFLSLFKNQGNPIDRVRGIIANGEKLTSLEKRCVDEAFSRLLPADAMIDPQLSNGVVAFGLWAYNDVEWNLAMDKLNMFPAEANEHLYRGAYSLAKAYHLFPLPVFLFKIGEKLNFVSDSTGDAFLEAFLRAHATFKPTDIDGIVMELMKYNKNEFVADARQRLGL